MNGSATAAAHREPGLSGPPLEKRRMPVPAGFAALPVPANVTYLPGEDVLLLSVPLPAMSAAQRRAAIGFAIEDSLAQPLDQVHVALGPQMAGGQWLVAVVSHSVLAGVAVPPGHRLLPDTLAVPVPDKGWAVLGQPGRVLVRLPDGTGFAASDGAAVQLWQISGAPPVLFFGGPLPRGMTVADTAPLPEAPDPLLARFDLRSGTAATDGRRLPRGVVPALAILAVFLGGHLLVAAADLVALNRIASARADQLRTVLAALGEPVGDNLNNSLSRALAARDAPARPDFLDLATRVFGALADQSGAMSLRDLRYEAGQDLLIMTVEAGTLEALQGVENALLADGLVVRTGAATTGDGAAEVQMTVGRGAT